MLHWYNSAQPPKVRIHIKKKEGEREISIRLELTDGLATVRVSPSPLCLSLPTAPKESARVFQPDWLTFPPALGSLFGTHSLPFFTTKSKQGVLDSTGVCNFSCCLCYPPGFSHCCPFPPRSENIYLFIYSFIQMRYLNISCLFTFPHGDAQGHSVIQGKWWHVRKAAMKPLEY